MGAPSGSPAPSQLLHEPLVHGAVREPLPLQADDLLAEG